MHRKVSCSHLCQACGDTLRMECEQATTNTPLRLPHRHCLQLLVQLVPNWFFFSFFLWFDTRKFRRHVALNSFGVTRSVFLAHEGFGWFRCCKNASDSAGGNSSSTSPPPPPPTQVQNNEVLCGRGGQDICAEGPLCDSGFICDDPASTFPRCKECGGALGVDQQAACDGAHLWLLRFCFA
jgi:hypothetical protein